MAAAVLQRSGKQESSRERWQLEMNSRMDAMPSGCPRFFGTPTSICDSQRLAAQVFFWSTLLALGCSEPNGHTRPESDTPASSASTQGTSDEQPTASQTHATEDGGIAPFVAAAGEASGQGDEGSTREETPRSSVPEGEQGPEAIGADAGVSVAILELRPDAGAARPEVPATLFETAGVVLDQAALQGCEFAPMPASASPDVPVCDVCSDDLTCTVPSPDPTVNGYIWAVARLGLEVERIRIVVDYWLEQAVSTIGKHPGFSGDENTAILSAAFDVGLDGKLEGGIRVDYPPPSCGSDVSLIMPLAATCDPDVEPSAPMDCAGICRAPGADALPCSSGELTCIRSRTECRGSCTGECLTQTDASCQDHCMGDCQLDGRVACPGQCLGEQDSEGYCTGSCQTFGAPCPGACSGSCELLAGGTCEGSCLGECRYTEQPACSSAALTECSALEAGTVQCLGDCDGKLKTQTLPACDATIEAAGALLRTCTMPKPWVRYQLSPQARVELEYDPDAQLALDHSLQCYGLAVTAAQSARARINGLLDAARSLHGASDIMSATIASEKQRTQDVFELFALACASEAMSGAPKALLDLVEQLTLIDDTCAALASVGE